MLHHKLIYPLLIFIFLLCGCSRSFAPDGWLPETDDYLMNIYGGWITLIVESDSTTDEKELYEYKGEFLAVDSEYVYLLADSVYIVNRNNIKNSLLELDEKNSSTFALWGAAFLLTPFVNGILCVITGPLGLISGFGAAVTESDRDRYEVSDPGEEYWENVSKFSRFPQGIPEGIELNRIRPKQYSFTD